MGLSSRLARSLHKVQLPAVCKRTSVMVSEQFQSPNAIPPRTSSSNINTSFLTSPTPTRTISPTKPVLTPVPEGDWIAQRNKMHTSTSTTDTNYTDIFDKADGVPSRISGQTWSPQKEKILLGPFDYMFDKPGKNIRRQLIAAFNACLRVPDRSHGSSGDAAHRIVTVRRRIWGVLSYQQST